MPSRACGQLHSDVRAWLALLAGLLLAALCATPVAANGGTIRLSAVAAGPYALTVFTSPSPLRAGPIDVSVLVQRVGTQDVITAAQVRLTLTPRGQSGQAGTFSVPATHDQATNKLFYAANVTLPAAGDWVVTIQVTGAAGQGAATFTVRAAATSRAQAGLVATLLAAVPTGLLGWFAWSRWRRQRMKTGGTR